LLKKITDLACFLGTFAGAPFSELDQTDQAAGLYAATKKAREEIAHEYI
jgi:nucleoside-diphosphate-sugar epimerase